MRLSGDHGRAKALDRMVNQFFMGVHFVFRSPSSYAITYKLARRLSGSEAFKDQMARLGIKSLNELGDLLSQEGGLAIASEPSLELALAPRFVATLGNEQKIDLICDKNEGAGPRTGSIFLQVLLEGKIFAGIIRTYEEQLSALREKGDYPALMEIGSDFSIPLKYNLQALDELSWIGGLEVQNFLRVMSRLECVPVAIHALHALTVRGEAHDLGQRLLEQGGLVACHILLKGNKKDAWSEYCLYLALRSLAMIEAPDYKLSVKLFDLLGQRTDEDFNPLQYSLIGYLRNGGTRPEMNLAIILTFNRLAKMTDPSEWI